MQLVASNATAGMVSDWTPGNFSQPANKCPPEVFILAKRYAEPSAALSLRKRPRREKRGHETAIATPQFKSAVAPDAANYSLRRNTTTDIGRRQSVQFNDVASLVESRCRAAQRSVGKRQSCPSPWALLSQSTNAALGVESSWVTTLSFVTEKKKKKWSLPGCCGFFLRAVTRG